MYVSIRQFKTNSAGKLTRQAHKTFLPLVRQAAGFIAYHCISTGNGAWASISIFDTQANADGSIRMTADWVKKNRGLVLGPPEITAGEVTVRRSGRAKNRLMKRTPRPQRMPHQRGHRDAHV